MFRNFIGLFKMSKTLRFELKPIGATLENLRCSGALERDFVRAEKYQVMKDVLDFQHKALLERTLSSADNIVRCMDSKDRKDFSDVITDEGEIKWDVLAKAYADFRMSDKDQEARTRFDDITSQFRKLISAVIKADEKYKSLKAATPSDFIKYFLSDKEYQNDLEQLAAETFNKFACYFIGFQENRSNIYTDKPQKTAAANRAINENFPRYLKCSLVFNHIKSNYPDIIIAVEKELSKQLLGLNILEFFSIGKYSNYLSQSGIEKFNCVTGVFNQQINLKKQSDENARQDKKFGKMPSLYKQILSDRESASFIIEKFKNDSDVLSAIRKFSEYIESNEIIKKLREIFSKVQPTGGIFVLKEYITAISNDLYGDWRVLDDAVERVAEEKFSHITARRERGKAVDQWIARNEYSLSDFSEAVRPFAGSDNWVKVDICEYWHGDKAKEMLNAVESARKEMFDALGNDEKIGLRDRKDDVKMIKGYLDSVLNVLRLVKPLHVGLELDRDLDFYGEFDALYDVLDEVVPLYNQIRNYITSKPSEEKKLKLMFDSPTLAAGWDQNKEDANNAVLFEKDGQYYLGIVNVKKAKKERPVFQKLKSEEAVDCYRKMVYKLLPGPNKMLPKVFFSNKGLPIYKPSATLLKRFENGDYKKGANFDLRFCHSVIDFFKKSISIHPDWSKFGFKFSPTSSYDGIDQFYREISDQGYKISFDKVPAKTIDSLVEDGALYLFKLHNKDFSSGSNGRPNLHSIYWRMLFNADNLADIVFKLNGEGELFYRRASIKNPYVHNAGEKFVNRIDRDGRRIPDDAFGQLFKFANGEIPVSQLSGTAKDLYEAGKVVVKDVKHRVVKDGRFTEDKFFFHIPITINAKANDKVSRFNDSVNNAIRNCDKVNVIGIDRGERHLLYVTVIDGDGKILEQRSFNTLGRDAYDGKNVSVDYHSKLDQAEKSRDKARKSWSEIGKIKDLKAGYLSAVVHEIARMIMKYNAIVALEDLNFGFKRGRIAIEKQVYQKFEKAMIDKLNYLVFKDRDHLAEGGVLRGYQLSDKFESFEKLGKQTGFIYYVPSAYTSKIDPTTGFTNIFDLKNCTHAEGIKNFFGSFDSVLYSAADNAFAFTFNYDRFNTRFPSWKSDWTVYTASRRLVYNRDKKGEEEINPTAIICEALSKRGIKVDDGFDLYAYMRDIEPIRENAAFFKNVFYAFERTLQMRNSSAKTGEDYIESPVKNKSGGFFRSNEYGGADLPQNADANGAYHIALKGLWVVEELKTSERPNLAIRNEQWLEFVQKRHW